MLLYIFKESNVTHIARHGYSELHVFPTHTSLVGDLKAIGTCAFRFLVYTLPCAVQIVALTDTDVDSDGIRDMI